MGCVHHDRPAGWNMVIIVNIRLSQGFLWDGENVLELDSSDGWSHNLINILKTKLCVCVCVYINPY